MHVVRFFDHFTMFTLFDDDILTNSIWLCQKYFFFYFYNNFRFIKMESTFLTFNVTKLRNMLKTIFVSKLLQLGVLSEVQCWVQM